MSGHQRQQNQRDHYKVIVVLAVMQVPFRLLCLVGIRAALAGCPGQFLFSHSLTLLLRCACFTFSMSAGVSCGRSIESVSLLIVPVNVNGH